MMTPDALYRLLEEMNVLCRDNGRAFTDLSRLRVIDRHLRGSGYLCTAGNLCRIYSRLPLDQLPGSITLVSSHVDCEGSISRCYSREVGDEMLQGTYDNSITNTAILALMLENRLPDHVVVAFTGDEEEESGGAEEVCRILKGKHRSFRAVILDVTEEGWQSGVQVSLENNFFRKSSWESQVIHCLADHVPSWCFVPSNPNCFPAAVPYQNRIHEEAEPDESWAYDEWKVPCFSLCLPVLGEMHSDAGVLCRKNGFLTYVQTLERICSL